MASSVFYRFNSRRDESRINFDGTGISLFDLKRDIILANNMSKANDFDLVILDGSTKQEYADDNFILPRSSSVVVKRVPANARNGKGKAALYTAGASSAVPTSDTVRQGGATYHKGAMSKRFDGFGKDEGPKPSTSAAPLKSAGNEDEAAAMAAMFEAEKANWEETQEKMSQATRIPNANFRGGFNRGGKPYTPHVPSAMDRPLPTSYVCYRCGQKGHWIKDCPTNDDRAYDNRPRIKRTTGIPRSMLKAVENPTNEQLGQGVMVTPEGGYVVAQPDLASWQKQVARPKGLTAAEVRERPSTDPSLVCQIDNKIFRDAVKTPCCGTNYCEECIQTHLLERDFVCPKCSTKLASLDKLVVDKPMRIRVTDYIERAVEESKKVEEEASPVKAAGTGDDVNLEQDVYADQQPGGDVDFQQILVDSIPQLQAQVNQISVMLQNPSLPNQLRQTTQIQHDQLKMQLEQAQTISMALASFQQHQQIQQQVQATLANGMIQQMNQQSAALRQQQQVQRRRAIKRERPSDFLEVGGEPDSKTPRYWE